jgi:tRNA-modifying protein YgfZ
MNPNWQEFLCASGANFNNGIVASFGHPSEELVAARDTTAISPLVHLGLLECAGEDAKVFLHNQLTSDVNHLAPGSAQHSAWCTAKGRMQASFLLYRNGPDYRALLSSDLLPTIKNGLQKYVLRSRVRIDDLSGTHEFIGVSGSQAEAVLLGTGLPVPEKMLETAVFPKGTVIRLNNMRFAIVIASEAARELWNALAESSHPVGTQAWQWLDIQSGIPLITEATKEAFVPQMVNFDKIGGVSFHKGCYPGQEIVARAQYLGKVKRHLYRIHTDTSIVAGTVLFSPESPDHLCGMVANAAPSPQGGFDALAVIQENFIEAGNLRLEVPGKTDVGISEIALVTD